jgi:hypothetical protein
MLAALLPVLGPVVGQVVRSLFPDPSDRHKADELQARFHLALIDNAGALERAALAVVREEARGESWLQRNWRPLTMLTFVALVSAKWLGFTAPGVSEAIELKLFSIIELGLGGYVIGRSAEKIAERVAPLIKS